MNYTDMTKFVLPYCRGCGDPLAIEQLRLTAIDFCERSKVLRRPATGVAVVVGTATYAIAIAEAADLEPYAVVDVLTHTGLTAASTLSGWTLPLYYDVVSPEEAGELLDDDAQKVLAYSTPAAGIVKQVTLNPVPLAAGRSLMTVCAVRPLLTGTLVPDDVAMPYIQVIAAGAIARLRDMVGEPWADSRSAQMRREEYEAGLARAVNNMAMGNSSKPLRTRSR